MRSWHRSQCFSSQNPGVVVISNRVLPKCFRTLITVMINNNNNNNKTTIIIISTYFVPSSSKHITGINSYNWILFCGPMMNVPLPCCTVNWPRQDLCLYVTCLTHYLQQSIEFRVVLNGYFIPKCREVKILDHGPAYQDVPLGGDLPS